MSMMAQKLNRQGTVAFAQLGKLIDLYSVLTEISDLNSQEVVLLQHQNVLLAELSKSDLYKMAKEFAPHLPLVPLTKSWLIDFNQNNFNTLNFDGRYFGYFKISLSSMHTANNDNGYKSSFARIYDGTEIATQSTRLIHGDDILSWSSVHNEFLGFGTSMLLATYPDNQTPEHGLQVHFIGYKLGDAVDSPPPPRSTYPVYLISSRKDEYGLSIQYEGNNYPDQGLLGNPRNIPNDLDLTFSNTSDLEMYLFVGMDDNIFPQGIGQTIVVNPFNVPCRYFIHPRTEENLHVYFFNLTGEDVNLNIDNVDFFIAAGDTAQYAHSLVQVFVDFPNHPNLTLDMYNVFSPNGAYFQMIPIGVSSVGQVFGGGDTAIILRNA